jgi:hypothetical protein
MSSSERDRAPNQVGPRVLDAALHLLDRQLVDADGRLAGKVDDLELTFSPEGGPPYVSAILTGPGALARRLGGRLGAWLASIHGRLHPEAKPGPARVAFGVVKRIGPHIELSLPKADLPTARFEEWARDHVIDHIPGAAHAPE